MLEVRLILQRKSRVSIINVNEEGRGLLILCQTVSLLAIVLMTEPAARSSFPASPYPIKRLDRRQRHSAP